MRKMTKVLILFAVLVAMLFLVVSQVFRLEVVETPVKALPTVRADYVELCSLSNVSDSTHTIRISGRDEMVWYREERPGLSLGCCDLSRVYAAERIDGGFSVVVGVRESCMEDLEWWSRDRVGQMVGVVLEGNLVEVSRLGGVIAGSIAIPGFPTMAAADEMAEKILIEGFGFAP